MSRTIKFRAWNKQHKMLSEPFTLRDVLFGRTQGADFRGSEFIQFTGLTDKNGKEIYEGDFVRGKLDEGMPGEPLITHTVGLVSWDEEYGGWIIRADDIENFQLYDYEPLDEVVGNIYQDKHLLDGVQQES